MDTVHYWAGLDIFDASLSYIYCLQTGRVAVDGGVHYAVVEGSSIITAKGARSMKLSKRVSGSSMIPVVIVPIRDSRGEAKVSVYHTSCAV